MQSCILGEPGCPVRGNEGRHVHAYRPPAGQRWRCYQCRGERWSFRFGGPVPVVVSCATCGRKSTVLTDGEKLAVMLGKPPFASIDQWKAEVTRAPMPAWLTGEHPQGTYHLEIVTSGDNLHDLYFTSADDRAAFAAECGRLFSDTRACDNTDHPGRTVLAQDKAPF